VGNVTATIAHGSMTRRPIRERDHEHVFESNPEYTFQSLHYFVLHPDA
jgi:hypothetical protein